MRVLYFSKDLTTHDIRFVGEITRRGHEVFYLRLQSDGIPYTQVELPEGSVAVEWAGGGRPVTSPREVLGMLPALVAVLQSTPVDLVHAGPIQTCALLSVLADLRPTVAVSWGSDMLVDALKDEWRRWATSMTLTRASGFVCDSEAVARSAIGFGFQDGDRLARFPWGLQLGLYKVDGKARDERRRQLTWQDAFVLIATRAWHREYRLDVVIDGFALARAANPGLKLILAGTGSNAETAAIRTALNERHLQDNVHCAGMVAGPELNEWLSASDAYISSVPTDGTSISLLEAMLYGLPAVVVDNAGNREWVDHGINGFTIRDGDAAGMAEAITALQSDRERARAMGQEGRRRVVARADFDRNVDQLFTLYERVLGHS